MSNIIDSLERAQLRPDLPQFKAGDTVRVHFQVIEGQRRRIQVYEGIVIKRQGSGARETFTVRKQSFGVGVERTFPLHSPKIEKIDVQQIGDVNRAKLYYLRGRVGKRARIREKRGPERSLRATAAAPAAPEGAGGEPGGPAGRGAPGGAGAAGVPGEAAADQPQDGATGDSGAPANEPRADEDEAVPASTS